MSPFLTDIETGDSGHVVEHNKIGSQLNKIDDISDAQWGYVGAMDQGVDSTDSPTFVGLTLSGLTASRLTASDGGSGVVSVANLASWIAGTANQVTVTDDSDGTITLSTPQDTHTGASPTFASMVVSDLTDNRVVIAGTSGVLEDDANLTWDGTTFATGGKITVVKTLASGALSTFTHTQNAPNAADVGDETMALNYTLTASSATNELVVRALNMKVTNNLTGGGALQNIRVVNLATNTETGTTTTSMPVIYIEAGTSNGTVTTGYGIQIASLQGTTKWGIYDNTGSNWVLGGDMNIGTVTDIGSRLQVINTASSSGSLIKAVNTQTTPNAGDTSDTAQHLEFILSANSATNELVVRAFNLIVQNALTGGGALQNMRVLNLSSKTSASTTTTDLPMIYIEVGDASGTVTTGYGIRIAAVQGTTAWGIYDQSGADWYQGGKVGIGIAGPNAKLDVDQTSTTAAIPVLRLDQADVSEEFIKFIGTAASGVLTQSIVDEGDQASETREGWLKIYVVDDGNQITDQAYFIPIYTLSS